MIKKYVKKPVMVEAVRWTGENLGELINFVREYLRMKSDGGEPKIYLITSGGYLQVSVGDYIIKGVQGEFHLCKPNIFKQTYKLVDY